MFGDLRPIEKIMSKFVIEFVRRDNVIFRLCNSSANSTEDYTWIPEMRYSSSI